MGHRHWKSVAIEHAENLGAAWIFEIWAVRIVLCADAGAGLCIRNRRVICGTWLGARAYIGDGVVCHGLLSKSIDAQHY
jgi:hypothetical protein